MVDVLSVLVQPAFSLSFLVRFQSRQSSQGEDYYLVCQGCIPGSGPYLQANELEQRERPVSREQACDLLRLLQNSNVPLLIENASIGVDGVTYELSIEKDWAKITYSWWGTPPKGWEPLGEIVDMLLKWAGVDSERCWR